MANKQRHRGSSKDAPGDSDHGDDLALPGEALEDDENLRLEVNIDREIWNRCLVVRCDFWLMPLLCCLSSN